MRVTTCRICRLLSCETNPSMGGNMHPMVRYGIRHSVHADCGLKKWGMDFMKRLTEKQLREFPVMAMRAAGMPGAVSAEINRRTSRA